MKKLDPTITRQMHGDTWGARMRSAREHAGIKQSDAAKRLGLSAGHLSRIERGVVGMASGPATLTKAAAIYGVSSVWLYAGPTAGRHLVPDWHESKAA